MILNETQIAVQDAVRAYAQEQLRPRSAEFEANGGYPDGLFEDLAELGLTGMCAPEEVGGAGLDMVSYALALVEIAKADGGLSTILSIQNSMIVGMLLKIGTDEQKAQYLPELTSGRMIGAFALTEAEAGSDASAIRTRATKDGNGWRLNGAKQFISNGRLAKMAIVFAVTDPEAGKKGISTFIVPTNKSGYLVDKVEKKLGQGASDTCAIRFDDLFLEPELMLGAEGEGYRIALANLETGRIGIAAQSIGMAEAALDIAVGYARERKSMGKLIMDHQAVGFRLADLAAKLEAARHLMLHAASLKQAGQPCMKEASMAKLVASETAELVVSGAIQTLGGYGYLEEFGLAKIYRDVRVCQIYEGTSDIQRMVIARSL